MELNSHPTFQSSPGPKLPPTPESPSNPTVLPHVEEHLPPLPTDRKVGHGPAPPITPPSLSDSDAAPAKVSPSPSLLTGLNVLHHTANALSSLHRLYATSEDAQLSFQRTVSLLSSTVRSKNSNRIVVSGVGKSAKIAQKFVVTLKSMRIRASFLHAAEALHGDLGAIEEGDCLVLVTFSGQTQELKMMMRHVRESVRTVVLTGWQPKEGQKVCPLLEGRDMHLEGDGVVDNNQVSRQDRDIILLAPIPVSEEEAFGVRAPTTSTTVALALCDSLALAIAGEVHGGGSRVEEVFRTCHPGGAIGKMTREENKVHLA